MGAITTKETYYFTSAKLGSDARELLIPWMGYNQSFAASDEAAKSIGNGWFDEALLVANVGIAETPEEFARQRSYTRPNAKLQMQQCQQYYLLEATPHSINSPVAARRMRDLFPKSKAVAVLKEPALRMHSAYNQFSKPFLQSCKPQNMAPWCPVYRYYQLRLPTFAQAVEQELEYMRAVGTYSVCDCTHSSAFDANIAAPLGTSARRRHMSSAASEPSGSHVYTNNGIWEQAPTSRSRPIWHSVQ